MPAPDACEIAPCKNPATKLRYGRKVCDEHAATWWDRVLKGAPRVAP